MFFYYFGVFVVGIGDWVVMEWCEVGVEDYVGIEQVGVVYYVVGQIGYCFVDYWQDQLFLQVCWCGVVWIDFWFYWFVVLLDIQFLIVFFVVFVSVEFFFDIGWQFQFQEWCQFFVDGCIYVQVYSVGQFDWFYWYVEFFCFVVKYGFGYVFVVQV